MKQNYKFIPFWIASLFLTVWFCQMCKKVPDVDHKPDTSVQDRKIDSLHQVISRKDQALIRKDQRIDSAFTALKTSHKKINHDVKKLKDLSASQLQHRHDSLMELIGLH